MIFLSRLSKLFEVIKKNAIRGEKTQTVAGLTVLIVA